MVEVIKNKAPKNYSQQAGKARKKAPLISKEQIYKSMRRSIRLNRVVVATVEYSIGVVREAVPARKGEK